MCSKGLLARRPAGRERRMQEQTGEAKQVHAPRELGCLALQLRRRIRHSLVLDQLAVSLPILVQSVSQVKVVARHLQQKRPCRGCW